MNSPDADDVPQGRFRARAAADPASPKIDPTQTILKDMAELADDARTIVAQGRAAFDDASGRITRHAADAIVIKFQELCERLPHALREAHPAIAWQHIRGMRNRGGHNYRATDYGIVWNTIARDIPETVAALED